MYTHKSLTKLCTRIVLFYSVSAILTTWRKGTGSQAANPIQTAESVNLAVDVTQPSLPVVLSAHAIDKIFPDDHLELYVRTPTMNEQDPKLSIYISALFLRDAN